MYKKLITTAIGLFFLLTSSFSQRDPSQQSARAGSGTVEPKRVKGKQFPPLNPGQKEDPNLDKPYMVPTGPLRGDKNPKNPKIQLKEIRIDGSGHPVNPGGAAVDFYEFNNEGTGNGVNPTPDVSVAANAGVVMLSYNTRMRLSLDGGNNFVTVDPTTVFPSGGVGPGNSISGPYCCDQVMHYVPSIDRFIWFMQFCGNGTSGCLSGKNIIRVAAASTADVISSGATAWTYWDITSTSVEATAGALDYPDVSYGDNSLYISCDAVNTGKLVIRLPLHEIQLGTGFTFWYTHPTDGGNSYGGHITQNTGNEVYWAGHVNTSKMRVFSWKESETTYYWRDRDINSWTQSYSSNTPTGINWLAFGFPGNAVIGCTRRGSEVWFAWNAGAQGGLSNAYIEVVKFRNSDYSVIEQMQIWNNDYAFAYPYFATNSDNEVGISLGWGGKTTEAHHAAGFMGDFIVYYPRLSAASFARYGDYVTIRRFNACTRMFSAGGYTTQKNAANNKYQDVHYMLFGRPGSKNGKCN